MYLAIPHGMSYFKEPQKAVSCIQRILDGDRSACVLLADLSKAFERVNPYWILALLRIRKAPGWLIAYTKFVLFHRRVTHKVQGRLLPSRTLRQGVDMGRSFSVYLFCLAMDPLFTYLNQISGVLAVQGYVDDTTIAGDGQDLAWIGELSLVIRLSRPLDLLLILMPATMLRLSSTIVPFPRTSFSFRDPHTYLHWWECSTTDNVIEVAD